MSDFIARRAKQAGLAEKWSREMNSRPQMPACSVLLGGTMNNMNASSASILSQRSRNDQHLFKMPDLPHHLSSNYTHSQTQLRPNTQLYTTISHNSMKYLLETARKTFLNSLNSYMLDFESSVIQNEERALLMYSHLNNIICDDNIACAPFNDENRLGMLFGKLAKEMEDFVKPAMRGSQAASQADPSEFEDAAHHSTVIENDFRKFNNKIDKSCANPSSSISSASRYGALEGHQAKMKNSSQQHNDRGILSAIFSSNFNNYSSISTEQLLGISRAQPSSQTQQKLSDNDCFSPDLSEPKSNRSNPPKNAKKKGSASRKFENSLSQPCQITNWTFKPVKNGSIELFGCTSGLQSSKPVSRGIILSRKANNLIRTEKGLFQLVGNLKASTCLPSVVRKEFKSHFPARWKKTLNESGIFDRSASWCDM